jgi:hypothetical protein
MARRGGRDWTREGEGKKGSKEGEGEGEESE